MGSKGFAIAIAGSFVLSILLKIYSYIGTRFEISKQENKSQEELADSKERLEESSERKDEIKSEIEEVVEGEPHKEAAEEALKSIRKEESKTDSIDNESELIAKIKEMENESNKRG